MWESDITHEDFLSGTSVFGSITEHFLMFGIVAPAALTKLYSMQLPAAHTASM